jgi:tetratricopeptide (TPR) repeat protein
LAVVLVAAAAYGGRALWLEHHFRAAEQAAERRDFDGARDHLNTYLAAYPDSGRGHFLAGRVERRAGRFEDAKRHLEKCRQQHYQPEAVDLERRLIQLARGEQDWSSYLHELVEHDHADSLLILEVLIDYYLRNYRLHDALGGLDRYLASRPDDVPALLGRAFVHEKLFSFSDADADYRRALAVDPENEGARRRFAELLVNRTGTPDEAAAEYLRLRERRPEEPAYQLGLARARRSGGQLDEARQLLTDLLRLQPHYPGTLTEIGRVAADQGKWEEAVDWLHKAIAEAPRDRVAYSTLLNCLHQLDQTKEERKNTAKALKQGSGDTARAKEERDCRETLDRLDADLKRIGKLTLIALKDPYNVEVRYELGVLFLRNDEEAEGVRWLGLALEQDPGHAGAHRALAEHFEKKGRPDLAAPHRRAGD